MKKLSVVEANNLPQNVKDIVCDKCGKTMHVESIACEYETPVRKLYRCSCGESKYVTI